VIDDLASTKHRLLFCQALIVLHDELGPLLQQQGPKQRRTLLLQQLQVLKAKLLGPRAPAAAQDWLGLLLLNYDLVRLWVSRDFDAQTACTCYCDLLEGAVPAASLPQPPAAAAAAAGFSSAIVLPEVADGLTNTQSRLALCSGLVKLHSHLGPALGSDQQQVQQLHQLQGLKQILLGPEAAAASAEWRMQVLLNHALMHMWVELEDVQQLCGAFVELLAEAVPLDAAL
jgi:hypothetical protein